MSHRDRGSRTGSSSHAQDLSAALDWLLADVDLAAVVLRAESRWSARGLLATALLWVWTGEVTLTGRLQMAMKVAGRLWPEELRQAISYQAFCKLLVRWTEPLLAAFLDLLRQRMRTTLKAHFHLAGFCVFGVDGSKLELPRTAANEARFAPSSTRLKKRTRRSSRSATQSARARYKKADSPQLFLTTLWHAGTGLPWNWRIGPSDSSERRHLCDMIDSLPSHALVTADAGFVGHAYWKALLDSGRQFLIRVGANVRLLKQLGVARESAGTVYLWPDDVARRHEPPLVLRLIVVQGTRHPWYLVTSIRDPRDLSDQQVIDLYRRRWGIELFYRHFKQTFARRRLRSQTPDHGECEAHWSLAGLWALLLHAEQFQHRRHIPPARLSVAGVLHAYRTTIREYKSLPDPGESLAELLVRAVIDNYQRRNKASRGYPRKKYDKPCEPPLLIKATRQQIELAKQLRTAQRKRLTA